jgi:integrase
MRRALNDAVRWGKLARAPAGAADPPGPSRRRAQAWSARELQRFLEHVEGDRLYALWRLAATTGMRRGELLGLTWRSLDGARLEVSQQLLPTTGGHTFGPPKSRRSERTIALDPQTVDALNRLREQLQLERALAAEAYGDQDLVFCDELGGTIRPGRLTEMFRRHAKAAKLIGNLHILRHTHAAQLLTATPSVPQHVVAGRLGDDPKTVLGTYAHLPHSDGTAAATAAAIIADIPLTNTAI